mgnify:FL=1|jgi:dUTP pyrophosphatase
MLKIKVERTHEDAVIPEFAHPTDSGFDLFTCEDTSIYPGETVIVPTGLRFEIPKGWGVQIKNKSGITVKGVPVYTEEHGFNPFEIELVNKGERAHITVFEGTVDMDYRGDIGIMVRNDSKHKITIPAQTKIAQGVLRQVFYCEFEEVDTVETNTARGEGGYGSTGTEKK